MPRDRRPFAWALAVGTVAVVLAGCGLTDPDPTVAVPTSATSTSMSSSTSTSTSILVVPTTTWIPIGVDCSSQPLTRWETEPEPRPTPERAVRWWTDQPLTLTAGRVLVQADDEIRLVGDPQAAAPVYVSVRAGVPATTFGLTRSVEGWRATPFEGCRRDHP